MEQSPHGDVFDAVGRALLRCGALGYQCETVVGALVAELATRGWEDWQVTYERYRMFDGFAEGFHSAGVFGPPPPAPVPLP